jgi:hypothetical protein
VIIITVLAGMCVRNRHHSTDRPLPSPTRRRVTIDTLTDVYAGDEIDRNQTTQFVKLLQHLAIKARCSVAILAHPSNAGMATGSGLSGSAHSMTSSASNWIELGTSMLSALAVCRLITNSNLVDCTTGKSVGFSPLRMRPT